MNWGYLAIPLLILGAVGFKFGLTYLAVLLGALVVLGLLVGFLTWLFGDS
jgi:hypothetical protein